MSDEQRAILIADAHSPTSTFRSAVSDIKTPHIPGQSCSIARCIAPGSCSLYALSSTPAEVLSIKLGALELSASH